MAFRTPKTFKALINEGPYPKLAESCRTIGLKPHHTAQRQGYISRQGDPCRLYRYEGRFGQGMALVMPHDHGSTWYLRVEYWLPSDPA